MASLNGSAGRLAGGVRSWIEAATQIAGGWARLEIGLLLGIAYGLDGADKATMSAVAGVIEKSFSIGNVQIGLLIALVSFVCAAFTLPCGVLVDPINRRRILLGAIALWTAAMLVSGTATSYTYLLVTRLFLGAVTAAVAPAVASLVGVRARLSDAPASNRGRIWSCTTIRQAGISGPRSAICSAILRTACSSSPHRSAIISLPGGAPSA